MPQPAAPAPAPVAAAPAPAPVEAGGDSITLALSAISEKWPQAVRDEIASLKNASVSLPVNKMEAGMKAGKLAFPWGDLSQWISPSPTVGAQNRQTMVEVPLSAAAPAFMAHRRPAAAQRKVEIPESIPGVFTGAQTPEAPVAAPAPAPEPAVPAEPERQTLGQLLGQPDRTDWSPQLITQHVCMGEGIAGCLLTASDGLLVSAQMPHHINCEILSAFVPQMFSRMSQSADEMRLGGVTGIVITAGSAPYGIYRAGSLYLVVLGEAGRGLPDTKLHQIAAEIAGINP
jgi:predicted regulator of Ras-like GTPase activity (Roadblock/LC7/MglB family)